MAEEKTRVMTANVKVGPGRDQIAQAIVAIVTGKKPPRFKIGGYRQYLMRPTDIRVRKTPEGPRVDLDCVGDYPPHMRGGAPLNGMRMRVRDYCPHTRTAPKIEELL